MTNVVNIVGQFSNFNAGLTDTTTTTRYALNTTLWPDGNLTVGVDPAGTLLVLSGWMEWINLTAGTVQYRFSNVAAGVGRTSTTRAKSQLRLKTIA